ncbi:MAG: tetratricopeptide repeat protein [Bacteroidota bacterium]|nr:tetratricopeptide repeat protein [Bacteroidota bacterium]
MENLKKILFVTLIAFFSLNKTIYSQEVSMQEAFNNSYTLEYNGEYMKAVEAIKKGYDEKSYGANLRAGWLNYEAGLYIESQNYYKKAIALKPNSIEAKLGYIYPAKALGNMDQVIAQYKKILETDPQNSTANYQMGLIFYDKKNFRSAYKYFEKVVNLYPFGYDALLMYAWSNFQLGKNKEAKILFKNALLLSPYSQSAIDGLSLIK